MSSKDVISEDDYIAFGELVKKHMTAPGKTWTQEALALQVFGNGSRHGVISNIIAGKAKPGRPIIKAICEALEIDEKYVPLSMLWPEAIDKRLQIAQGQRKSSKESLQKSEDIFAYISELTQIDERLADDNADIKTRASLEERKSYLLPLLKDRLLRSDNPEQYLRALAYLQKVSFWNKGRLRRLKYCYVEIAEMLLSISDEESEWRMTLICETVENLYANGNKLKAFDMMRKEKQQILLRASPKDYPSLREHSDISIEAGFVSADELLFLWDGYSENIIMLELAKNFRCQACYFSSLGNYDLAQAAIEEAYALLSKTKSETPERRTIDAYLYSMSVILDWRFNGKPDSETFAKIEKAILKVSQCVPDDRLLLASLCFTKLQMLKSAFSGSVDRIDVSAVLGSAAMIKEMTRESVVGHCMLNYKNAVNTANFLLANPTKLNEI